MASVGESPLGADKSEGDDDARRRAAEARLNEAMQVWAARRGWPLSQEALYKALNVLIVRLEVVVEALKEAVQVRTEDSRWTLPEEAQSREERKDSDGP